jgi:hypothetical protein
MRQFRVVLRGPGAGAECSVWPSEAALQAELGALSSNRAWFRPEPVRVRLSRSLRAVLPPADWELPLVGRAAAFTLATAGVLGGLSGAAQASPQAILFTPPGMESSSKASFMPTDRPPEVVLLEAREVRGADSLRYTPGAPLTDQSGHPILIAAYHSNLPGTNHSNSPGKVHANTPSTPHSNTPPTPHSNTPGKVHANTPPTPHANTPPTPHSNTPGKVHANMPSTPHSNLPGKVHANTPSTPHGNFPGKVHANTPPTPHGNSHVVGHTNEVWSNHSNVPGGHTDSHWQNHGNAPPPAGGGFHTNMVQGDYVF